jgi:putative copper resistance protein D
MVVNLVRWLHLVPGLLLVGVFTVLLIAERARRPTAQSWESRLLGWTRWLVVLVPITGVAVLAHHVAYVAGRPAAALDAQSWLTVLGQTQFGTVWLVRHGLFLLLAALVFLREREDSTADWVAFRGEAWLLGAGGAAALAWAGHAAAVEPGWLLAALADAVHVVAAGVWLGALLPLALLLRAASSEAGADSRPYAVLAIRRFSMVALVTMLALIGTGLLNTWTQVGDVAALVGTRYGRLLILKVLLLLPILGLAAVNRRRLLPALSGDGVTVGRPAMARLARQVTAEWALGMLILVVVSFLSTTPPGRHDSPWWPLSFRLDYGATTLPGIGARFFIGGQIALMGLLVVIVGCLLARWRLGLVAGGIAGIALGLSVALPPLAVDAYPTTYRRSTVPYTGLSVASGLTLYGQHCVACHGATGRGDGPGGAGLPKPPADLTAPHTTQHTAGDLFWWITHGITPSGMPAFGDRLSEDDRWDLINLLRAISAADQAQRLGPVVEPNRPWLAAPDFSYAVGPGPGQTLKDFRGRRPILLVLFSLPGSKERLGRLAHSYDTLRGLGAEVLAVPVDGGERIITRLGADPPILFPVVTEGSVEITRAYALLGRSIRGGPRALDAPPPPHMELLIDRYGYVRARWLPGDGGPGWSDPEALVPELQQIAREAPAAPPAEHVH